MKLFPDDKILMIHIPKTGGECFQKYAELNNKKIRVYKSAHRLIKYEDYIPYKDWKIVTIIRNSYERIASLYRFRYGMEFKTLEDFVFNTDQRIKKFNQLYHCALDSTPFIEDVCIYSNIIVDEFIIYSKTNLIRDISKIFGDTEYKYPPKNQKTHYYGDYDWRKYYSDKARKEVARICKQEIELFNFEFDK